MHGHRLIDGHHRAAHCRELGIPYYVYILSEKESIEILSRAPKGARPKRRKRARIALEMQEYKMTSTV